MLIAASHAVWGQWPCLVMLVWLEVRLLGAVWIMAGVESDWQCIYPSCILFSSIVASVQFEMKLLTLTALGIHTIVASHAGSDDLGDFHIVNGHHMCSCPESYSALVSRHLDVVAIGAVKEV